MRSRFLAEIFQDVDGGYSAKRTAFFILLALFVSIIFGIGSKAFDKGVLEFMQGALEKIADLLKWLGGFIVAERAPSLTGKKDNV
jgi:hypothetical protein